MWESSGTVLGCAVPEQGSEVRLLAGQVAWQGLWPLEQEGDMNGGGNLS